jgi:hypothetical protein
MNVYRYTLLRGKARGQKLLRASTQPGHTHHQPTKPGSTPLVLCGLSNRTFRLVCWVGLRPSTVARLDISKAFKTLYLVLYDITKNINNSQPSQSHPRREASQPRRSVKPIKTLNTSVLRRKPLSPWCVDVPSSCPVHQRSLTYRCPSRPPSSTSSRSSSSSSSASAPRPTYMAFSPEF